MEATISKEVQDRLNRINWESLKSKYGISKDSIMQNPAIASQLAFGQYTDLIPGSTEEISGMFSLRAYPQAEGQEWKVKVYTMEKPKTEADTLYLYGQPIITDVVKKALLERTSWEGNDGSTKRGFANANGGRPIAIEVEGRKQQFLVSIHQPTNRVVGIPVEQVRLFFVDKEGASRSKGMYGVSFSEEQVKALCEGKAVRMDGCQTKNGESFSCYVQFDAAQRQVVPCHPGWLKEAQKTGTDLGLNRKAQEQAKEEKPAVEQEHKTKTGPKMR